MVNIFSKLYNKNNVSCIDHFQHIKCERNLNIIYIVIMTNCTNAFKNKDKDKDIVGIQKRQKSVLRWIKLVSDIDK